MPDVGEWIRSEKELVVGLSVLFIGLGLIAWTAGPGPVDAPNASQGLPGGQTDGSQTEGVDHGPQPPSTTEDTAPGQDPQATGGHGSTPPGSGEPGMPTDPHGSQDAGTPSPDLTVASIAHTPSDPRDGDEITFEATVANEGGGDAGGTFIVRFLLDGVTHDEIRTHAPEPDSSVSVTSKAWDATSGEHTLKVIADPADRLAEGDEANNAASHGFSVEVRLLQLPFGPDEQDEDGGLLP